MSSAYRYVAFVPGKQPTVEEISQLKEWSALASLRYAIGTNSRDGGLAFAFEAEAFARSLSANSHFRLLLERWEMRGSQITERLPFVKDQTALRLTQGGFLPDEIVVQDESPLKQKQLAAQESLGRAGLKLHQTLQQHVWLHRVAVVVPYALMGLGALLVIVMGTYASQKLSDSNVKKRQDTIKRVASDAMQEPLKTQSKSVEETDGQRGE